MLGARAAVAARALLKGVRLSSISRHTRRERLAAIMTAGGLQKAVVTSLPSEDTMTIAITLAGRQRFMDRPKSEVLERTLARMQLTAAKPEKRKKRSQGSEVVPVVSLLEGAPGSAPIASDTPNVEAWRSGRTLRVGDQLYHVIVNPPSVLKVEVHGLAMVGYPLCPFVALQCADKHASRWRWLVRRPTAAASGPVAGPGQGQGAGLGQSQCSVRLAGQDAPPPQPTAGLGQGLDAGPGQGQGALGAPAEWQEVGAALVYTPAERDLGAWLRVECTPVARSADGSEAVGVPISAEVGPVGRGPADPPAAARHESTPAPLAPPGLRVVTYNVLADQYAATEHAQRVLFGYCPTQFLAPEYRRPLIVQEVLGYHADVLCLQEVDESFYRLCLYPHLDAAGFSGHYTNKAGKTREGTATFFRRSRLRLVRRADVSLKELFRPLSDAAGGGGCSGGSDVSGDGGGADGGGDGGAHMQAWLARFLPMLRDSPALAAALQRVRTIGQLTVLAPTSHALVNGSPPPPEGPLCVVNTHLFFHLRAPHIRTMHVAALLQQATALVEEAAANAPQLRGRRPALLFCGDLNSDMNDGVSGAVELLRSGRLAVDHWDWRVGAGFSFTPEEDDDAAGGDGAAPPGAATASSGGGGGLGVAPLEDGAAVGDASNAPPAAAGSGSGGGGGGSGAGIGGSGQAVSDGEAQAVGSGVAEADQADQGVDRAGDAEQAHGVDLEHEFQLASVDELATPFTNYVRGYSGLLDYVWYEPARLAVRRVLPQPPAADLAGWLPSARHPSDHLAVVADLEWRPHAPDAPGSSPPYREQRRAQAGHSDTHSAEWETADGAAAADISGGGDEGMSDAPDAEPQGPHSGHGGAVGSAGGEGREEGRDARPGGPMPQRRRLLGGAPAGVGQNLAGSAGSHGAPCPAAVPDGTASGLQGSSPVDTDGGGSELRGSSPAGAGAAACLEPSAPRQAPAGAWGDSRDSERPGEAAAGFSVAPTPVCAPGAAAAAVAALAGGGVIAVPTDTLYGLACDAASAAGVAVIYAIKGRAASAPLAVCVGAAHAVAGLAEIAHLPAELLPALLPGPVTLLLTRRRGAPLCAELNPGVATVGVRVPDSAFLLEVCRRHGGALALTSANPSSGTSPVNVNEFQMLWPRCAAVFDSGVIDAGRAGSTIVDLTDSACFRVVRSGSAEAATRAVLARFGLQEAARN